MNRFVKAAYDAVGGKDEFELHERDLITAIGAMFEKAFAKKAAPTKPKQTAPFTAKLLMGALRERTEGRVAVSVSAAGYTDSVQKMLDGLEGLTAADMDVVIDWINVGGLQWWSVQPRWDHVLRHFPAWVSQARQWESKGRPALTEEDKTWESYSG